MQAGAIGILGGTFDPVHNAHLAMARAALAEFSLKKILFIPTGVPPYRTPPVASQEHRLAMLRLALDGEPRYAIDERELAPGHSGYSVDTVKSLGGELVLLMGADQYAKLETWHRWKELLELCTVAVFARPGWKTEGGGARIVPMPALEISASDIRARLARGEDLAAMLPASVLAYIREHGLYR